MTTGQPSTEIRAPSVTAMDGRGDLGAMISNKSQHELANYPDPMKGESAKQELQEIKRLRKPQRVFVPDEIAHP